jgi:SAM-dependent methyltransferase
MWAVAQRLRRGVRRYGIRGALREAAGLAATARGRRLRKQREREFDVRHNVDTAGIVRLFELDISSPWKELGVRYQGVNPEIFRQVMDRLPIDHRQFIFVDLGSGKGRALLLASEYPFKRAVGVEFAPELHAVAERNIRRFRSPRQQCHDIEAICTDATTFELPPEPTVLCFHNPFEEPVMRLVLERVQQSLRERPRQLVLLLFGGTQLRSCILDAGFTELAAWGEDGGWSAIYAPGAADSSELREALTGAA